MPIPEIFGSDIWDLTLTLHFLYYLFMSTLANESIFETLFEEALEEIGINESSPFYADAYKIAQQMAMNKFLSNNP